MGPELPHPCPQHHEDLLLEGILAQLVNKKLGTHSCDQTIQMTRKPNWALISIGV